ncbi:RRM domain-containing protein [Haematococcus lacustris]|uniref:RRM domain-containing protein n=1 Tax=Haematococcus lacustris TaxID=44745 RepID=A0A699ZGS9_HAELA|nr:RRM domain-containing protein [Haematococcus lacustris]
MLGSTYGLDPSTVAMGAMGGLETEITETPPAGCAPDAIKLFVGNIPKSCTEEQLLPFFETVGLVVELVIVRDKASHESKGSAFVWYASRANAERAILQLNLRHVLPDPSGQQDRPLVVRKAKSRANKMGNANYRGLQPMGLQPAPQLVGMQRAAAADDGGLYNSYARASFNTWLIETPLQLVVPLPLKPPAP